MDWLRAKMLECGLESLDQVAEVTGINKGTLYRYFTFEQRPSIDVLPALCEGLSASPLEILLALGVQVDAD